MTKSNSPNKEAALKLIIPFLNCKTKAAAKEKLQEIEKLIFNRRYNKESLELSLMLMKRWKGHLDKFMDSLDYGEKTSRDTFYAYKALREIIDYSDLLEE